MSTKRTLLAHASPLPVAGEGQGEGKSSPAALTPTLSRDRERGSEQIQLARDVLSSFDSASRYEWLITNGIGGFASGTVGGANTRRYHGLLIASLKPPLERTLFVSKLDVVATYGGVRYDLSTNEFADSTQSHGYRHLQSFRLEGTLPVWTYVLGDAVLEQRVWMVHGANTTYVSFTLARGERMSLEITPLCGDRDYHWQQRGWRDLRVGVVRDGIEVLSGSRAYRLLCSDAQFDVAPDGYWNFKHRAESERGLDDVEDLFRPGLIRIELNNLATAAVILTAEREEAMPAAAALELERARQRDLLDRAFSSTKSLAPRLREDDDQDWIGQLVLAADQFVVARTSNLTPHASGLTPVTHGATVIAGYPWFGDWGRDTMIALPGLTLTTQRFDFAASILRTFAQYVSEGMLPNRFPDAGEAPEYNTVDATLWYFVAIDEYWRATNDLSLVRELYPVLVDIVAWHVRGTRYGIGMDASDGLLRSGEPGVQLTWMDAKIGDWVVTPRTGKAVEINALWFNALRILQSFAQQLGEPSSRYEAMADRVQQSFERFWFPEGGYLYDVIDTPDGSNDASLRPNQIFALSLRHPLLESERARSIIERCASELWTPVGLRSLAPRDSSSLTPHASRLTPAARYAGRYTGSPHDRDAVYHQGTVWAWLLGPFALAHYRAFGDTELARSFLEPMAAHLRDACLGQISEIFDGDAPHAPRGCCAQAWSVSETLRAWSELNGSET